MKKILLSICCLCVLFAGCASDEIFAPDGTDAVENELSGMENGLPEMENKPSLMEIEPVVEGSWPEGIGRKNENTTAENLSFSIEISNPTTVSIACVTESGTLDMEIRSEDKETVFREESIQTETFEIRINSLGTYEVIVQAKEHTGSFWIKSLGSDLP